jgi:SPP1 family predicted phage head-tail adaptor
MDPGKFDRRLTLISKQKIPDGSGGTIDSWVDGDTVWAMRGAPRQYEQFRAGQTQTTNAVTITVRVGITVTTTTRVRMDGITYQVIGTPVDIKRRYLVFEAEELHG